MVRFSLVGVTVRGSDALQPLFKVSDPETELIIVDSRYSDEKRQQLKEIPHGFKQVVYAPPKTPEPRRRYDLVSALNTGYAYAEGDWVMRVDDWEELHPDFFVRLRETIAAFEPLFGTRFIVRPYDCTERWKNEMLSGPRYCTVPFRPGNSAGLLICHRSAMFDLNGFDERFDDATGWNDNDMTMRIFAAGRYFFIFDACLMGFRHPHLAVAPQERVLNRELAYRIFVTELLNGDYKSKNGYSLEELSKKVMPMKQEHVL